MAVLLDHMKMGDEVNQWVTNTRSTLSGLEAAAYIDLCLRLGQCTPPIITEPGQTYVSSTKSCEVSAAVGGRLEVPQSQKIFYGCASQGSIFSGST